MTLPGCCLQVPGVGLHPPGHVQISLSHCQGCAGRVWLCCILGNNLLSSLSAIPDGCPDKTMLPIKAKVSAAFALAAPVDPQRADSCDEQALAGEP